MLTNFQKPQKILLTNFLKKLLFIDNCVLEHFSLKRPQLIYKNLLSLRKIKKVNSMNMYNHIIICSFKVSDGLRIQDPK